MRPQGPTVIPTRRVDINRDSREGHDVRALTCIKWGSEQGNDVRALGLQLKRDSKQGRDVHALRLGSNRRMMCGVED